MADEDGNDDLNVEGNQPDPVEQLRAQLHARDIELAELKGRLSAPVAPIKAEDPPREFSRIELRREVSLGNLSEDEMDRILETQNEARISRQVASEVSKKVDETTIGSKLAAQIAEYTSLKPETMAAGSADRQRVADEWNYLLSIGQPKTLATELAALRAVYGPISRLKSALSAGEGRRETHRETGGGESVDPALRKDGIPKGLSARHRSWYQSRIDNGLYKGWDDPELVEELKYIKPRAVA